MEYVLLPLEKLIGHMLTHFDQYLWVFFLTLKEEVDSSNNLDDLVDF
jgi:hypothetical protein